MRRTRLAMVLFLAGGGVSTAALADSYWEVEAARANARAGGPTNERDAELLERYGCLSGTRSAFCEGLRERDRHLYRVEKRRKGKD